MRLPGPNLNLDRTSVRFNRFRFRTSVQNRTSASLATTTHEVREKFFSWCPVLTRWGFQKPIAENLKSDEVSVDSCRSNSLIQKCIQKLPKNRPAIVPATLPPLDHRPLPVDLLTTNHPPLDH